MAQDEVPVLIVGGSLVGMTGALLLGKHGVPTLVVEHHRGTAIHPRAASVTQRTMEIFRGLDLEPIVRARSAAQFVQDAGVVAVETLAGGATAHYIANFNDGIRDLSPCVRVFLSQNDLEPLLKESAEQHGARIEFATDCVAVEQDAEGVMAVVRQRDSGETRSIRARYLIAADGARSRIRAALGIGARGHGTFSNSVTIYFRANLRRFLHDRPWAVVYVNHPELRGFFRFEKPFDSGFLVVNTLGDPARPDVDVSRGFDAVRAMQLLRTAIGVADIPVTVENVMHWQATAQTAERFRAGRIFLAGDAAHVMPPTGGWGGNTGIQDVHNLAWKLALVLDGGASPALLDTYPAERRPVAELTVEQAYTRYVLRTDPSLPQQTMQPLVGDLEVELGYGYDSAAVAPDATGPAPLHQDPRKSRGQPGTRLPHYWLERNGQPVSTLDLITRDYVLLAPAASEAWCAGWRGAAERLGVRLSIARPGSNDLADPGGVFADGCGIGTYGCLLVRPDGFVAWRSAQEAPAAADRALAALGVLLGRA